MRSRVLALLATCALILAGCSSLPRAGEVHEVNPSPTEAGDIGLTAQPPGEGDEPEKIVSGFLVASRAGLDDDFVVARQYLMDSAASEWNPLAQVRVYSDSQNTQISTIDSGAIRVTVGSLGSLSGSGVYTESANDAVITTDFSLAKNADGQWRIVSLEDGILLSEHLFDQLYVKSPLYFLSTDSSALVADLRWYPRKTFATNAVDGLLAGPSQWLAGGVHTAFPSGTSRAMAVDVNNGVATVDLSTEVLAASDAEQTLLATQLQRTLTASTDIQSVQITVAGAPLGADANADLSAYPFGSFSLSVLADGLPAQVSGGSAVPAIDNPALQEADLSDLAVGYDADQTQYAALANGGKDLMWIDTRGAFAYSLYSGELLIRPSFDSFGWVWTGETANSGTLVALENDGTVAQLQAGWLDGVNVRDIAVSREGTRIVVVCDVGGEAMIYVASITRDNQGVPAALGDPVTVGQRLADVTELAWMGPVTLVVLGKTAAGSETSLYSVEIGGPMSRIAAPYTGTIRLTAGRDESSITVLTDKGNAYGYDGGSWRSIATEVSAVAYPG
ncbi:MAG: hypothetical protein E7Z96_00490 [Actinomycetaceae bacterium]|jgi:hypothetical protein|nr:hypothetical protein [Actinomycetaceae bacterium]